MIRDQFFSDPNGGYAKLGDKIGFDRAWDNVLRFERETGLSLDSELTREQYLSLLGSIKTRKSVVYRNYKSVIIMYVRYLVENGFLPEHQEELLSSITYEEIVSSIDNGEWVRFHRGLNTLRDAIHKTAKAPMVCDETIYDPQAVILYLAWYGLSEEEILDYLKSDVKDDGIVIRGKKTEIPLDILQVFTRFRDSSGYFQISRGSVEAFHKYAFSPYLLRTERADRFNVKMLRAAVSRFNTISEKKYSLSYTVVYQSGVFNRAYQMECDGFQINLNHIDVVIRALCPDFPEGKNSLNLTPAERSAVLNRLRDYEIYKKLYR